MHSRNLLALVSIALLPLTAAAQDGPLIRTDALGRAARADVQLAGALPRTTAPGTPKLGVDPAWQSIGPFGGDVTDVAVRPGEGNIVLAAVSQSTVTDGGLYRSANAGATWSEVASLSGLPVYDLEFAADGTAYAGTLDSPWISSDAGLTWTKLDLGIGPNDQTLEVTLDPNTPGRLWAGVGGALFAQSRTVLRSDDGGTTWLDVTPLVMQSMSCKGIAVDPTDSNKIFACFSGFFGGGAVWRTTDAGATWLNISAGLPVNPMQDVHTDGTRVLVAGGQLFGSQDVGLYESFDDGATWQALHDLTWPSLAINDIEVDPTDANKIYLASVGSGVYFSADGGASWSFGYGGTGGLSTNEVSVAPSGTTPIFLGSSSVAVWRSMDGVTFSASSVGIEFLNASSVAANPLDPSELAVAFRGLNDGGVYSSTDGGQSWTLEGLPGTRYNTVAFAPDGQFHALSAGPSTIGAEGVYRREPGGWVSIGPDQGPLFESDLVGLLFSASDPSLILTSGSDFGVAGTEGTVWRSTDDGANWTKVYEATAVDQDVNDLARLPGGTERTLLAAVGTVAGGVLRSTDGGVTWVDSSVGLGLFPQATSLAVSAFDPNRVFVADDRFGAAGVFESLDGGQTWAGTGFQSKVKAIVSDPLRANRLFIGQLPSLPLVSRSIDDGATFAAFDTGLAGVGALSGMAFVSGDCHRLLIATSTGVHGRLASCELESDVNSVSLSAGGTQSLDLASGSDAAGAWYWIVGSATGTTPATVIGALSLPLVVDAYFQLTLQHPNSPPLASSLATFDAEGRASASFSLPAGSDPGLAGVTLYHAYGAFTFGVFPEVFGSSNATAVTLVP